MNKIYIAGGDLVLADAIAFRTGLLIVDGRIAAIGGAAPADAEIISAPGRYVIPGLIDIHTHGRLIDLTPDKIASALQQDAADAVGCGVTRFLPTLASAPVKVWLAALPALKDAMASVTDAAIPIGLHYEGIFINPAAAGAQPRNLILPFDPARADHLDLFDRAGDALKLVTFAPEVPGNERLIEICRERGIVMALGHSTAPPDEIARFFDQGVRHMTHLFNGMKPINHRDPGPPTAGLANQRISVDLICDGYHLHPEIVRLINVAKVPAQRILITDNVLVQLPGATPGKIDEPNRLPNGFFAGSRLRLNRAVRNYREFTGAPLPESVAMASLNPARLLGLDKLYGSLAPGKSADLSLAGRDLEIQSTFIAGKKTFSLAP
jgi:N-acetylglucosamine-6-phosphate deacetylase